jgi:hypothetical protein
VGADTDGLTSEQKCFYPHDLKTFLSPPSVDALGEDSLYRRISEHCEDIQSRNRREWKKTISGFGRLRATAHVLLTMSTEISG